MPNVTPTPTYEFITGNAGSGKTYTLKKRIEECRKLGQRNIRSYGTLTATTGIASINLSGGTGDTVCTLNSCLKYFDTNSLKDNFASRKLHNALKEVSRAGRNLIIDEVSMMDAQQLDLIYDALQEVNELQEVFNRGGLGLILSGDFAQLPPVKAEFCFNAKCWSKFQVTKLDKIWRQNDPVFMEALNAARQGDGSKCADLLCSIGGVKLLPIIDSHFDGTTIVPINKLVDSINKIRLDELLRDPANRQFEFKSFRWGRQHPEWKGIPESRVVCKNAYIMILANDSPQFSYANGSCGYIVDANIDNGSVIVKLKDGGMEVKVRKVTRCYYTKDTPVGCSNPEFLGKGEWLESEYGSLWADSTNELKAIQYKQYLLSLTESLKKPCQPYYNFLEEKWVIGEISYTPIRLAYASTVHKSQGLSLDSVQIDYSHAFFGEPSMSYVALSRCRTPEGLTIVGSKHLIEMRTNISSEILDWV